MRPLCRSGPLLLLLGVVVLGCNSSSPPGPYDVKPGEKQVVAKVTGMS